MEYSYICFDFAQIQKNEKVLLFSITTQLDEL